MSLQLSIPNKDSHLLDRKYSFYVDQSYNGPTSRSCIDAPLERLGSRQYPFASSLVVFVFGYTLCIKTAK